ncbi:MAG: dipeptidase PepV [Eubacteriaceae bacterium]|nr:dipeptidase PepV [Eubacteriaceae bacterium]
MYKKTLKEDDMEYDIAKAAKDYTEEAVNTIKRLVAIESSEGAPEPGKPFGPGPYNALQEALKISEEMGFETKDVDGYAGYAQIGQGEKLIGIVGHMDCVPLGEGWTHDPLGGEIENGRLYGRGTSDDKGASVAALYAMKIVNEMGMPLNKRIRFVFGTNEETGMKGVDYYLEKEGDFDMGFTPDAGFPICFGEKGSYHGLFSAPANTRSAKVMIDSISGGQAVNVVCNKVVMTVTPDDYQDQLMTAFSGYANGNNLQFETSVDSGKLTLTLWGKAAHASTPELGINAISHLMRFIASCPLFDSPFAQGYNEVIGLSYLGENCGMKMEDEFGNLTFNVGVINGDADNVSATIDIRYPLTIKKNDFKALSDVMEKRFGEAGLNVSESRVGSSLYKEKDSPMVEALYKAYVDVTGDTENKPYTMGGGTYAKHFDSIVAFGAEYPGSESGAHMSDESVLISEITSSIEIYARALVNLLNI